MGDAAATLSVEQVVQLISQAKSAGANPLVVGMQIFNSLGDEVTLSGDTLRTALASSGISIPGPSTPLVNAIVSISKAGVHLDIVLNQDTDVSVNNNRIRFMQEVGFDLGETAGLPGLNNIEGVAAHKLLSWINIQSVQLKQNQGRWSIAVGTSLTTVNIDLN